MKEKIMNIFKCFFVILSSAIFVGAVVAADQINQRHGGARLSVQDCRNQPLTPEVAREIERHRARMSSSHSKFVSVTGADIRESSEMPESVKQSISNGAYINKADENGNTVLHDICKAQNINLAVEFINYGAKLLPNNNGKCPQDFIDNLIIDVTDDEVENLRTLLVDEALTYSAPSLQKSFCKRQNGKRKSINRSRHRSVSNAFSSIAPAQITLM